MGKMKFGRKYVIGTLTISGSWLTSLLQFTSESSSGMGIVLHQLQRIEEADKRCSGGYKGWARGKFNG